MIIVVSDIHLGHEKSNHEDFLVFLKSELVKLDKNDHLVLLGDILEFWRGQNVQAALENKEIFEELNKLNQRTHVHYIIGNHDYSILKLYENSKKFPFVKVTKNLRIPDNGTNYYFVHGYELDVFARLEPMTIEEYEKTCQDLCDRTEEVIGAILSNLWKVIKAIGNFGSDTKEAILSIQDPPEERKNMGKIRLLAESPEVRSIFLGMDYSEFLLFGHTHKPFCNIEKKVANTGSWVGDGDDVNTFVQISSGKVELKQWKDGSAVTSE